MRAARGRWPAAVGAGFVAFCMLAAAGASSFAIGSGVDKAGISPATAASGAALSSTFDVNFTEVGLPSGTSWNLSVAGQTWTVTTSSKVLPESNGSYSYQANATALGGPWAAEGSYLVQGQPTSVIVSFAPLAPAPTAGSSASTFPAAGPVLAALGFLVVVLVIVVVVVAVAARRKAERPQPEHTSPTPPPPSPSSSGTDGTTAATDDDPLAHML